MTIPELERIAFHYNRALDFKRIAFDWDGNYGAEFIDPNGGVRAELCEFIFPRIGEVDLELIRDCYLEFGKASKPSFGAYIKMHLLGQELLVRGWKTYLIDYLNGAAYSVDSYATTARIDISVELATEILAYIEEKIKVTTDERELKLLEQIGRTRFIWQIKRKRG